jgi:D-alanine-D-alanine ligase
MIPRMSRDPSRKLRVAVLMGGASSEHDVSISSGLQVLRSLDPAKYEAIPVEIGRDGSWQIGSTPSAPSLAATSDGSAPREEGAVALAPATGLQAGVDVLRGERRIDVAFLALHGARGEDGTMQGLLTLAGIPFTGSGVLASALAMDKVKAKELFALHGIPVARHSVVTRRDFARADDREALISRVVAEASVPCVVKPVVGGSSVATHVVLERADLPAALEDALSADARALAEERLVGTEVTCGVLGGGAHEDAVALPVTEIVPASGTFFDYRAKYTKGACTDITPARIPEATAKLVQELSLRAHAALGCEGMSRTDFILRGDVPHALETNTIPGMTPLSLLPQQAAAAGMSFPELLDRLVRSALLRAEG